MQDNFLFHMCLIPKDLKMIPKNIYCQVGLASVQIAKAMGLRVLGTAGTPEGLQLVKDNGAVEAFNHREEGYTEKILVMLFLFFLLYSLSQTFFFYWGVMLVCMMLARNAFLILYKYR